VLTVGRLVRIQKIVRVEVIGSRDFPTRSIILEIRETELGYLVGEEVSKAISN